MSSKKLPHSDTFHHEGLYIPTRTIYLKDECNGEMVEQLVKNLIILESQSLDPINLIINNVGGDEYDAFGAIDAIRACRCMVNATVFGHAMSAGSLILQAADVRIMSPLSVQMIHYGTWGGDNHAKTTQQWAKEGLRIDKWMEQWYLDRIHNKHPAFKLSRLRAMLDHDTFLSAKESVDLGLADHILELKK